MTPPLPNPHAHTGLIGAELELAPALTRARDLDRELRRQQLQQLRLEQAHGARHLSEELS